jgi:hypothetical protein
MQVFSLEATDRTPKIDIDPQTGRIVLAGESFPEDVATFYGPVIDATSAMVAACEQIRAEFHLVYVNSSSMKALYRLFEVIDERRASGSFQSEIVWTYEADDDVMQELGEDFKDQFPDLSFQITVIE